MLKFAWFLWSIIWLFAFIVLMGGVSYAAGGAFSLLSIAYVIYRIILSRRRKAQARAVGAHSMIKVKHVGGLQMGNTLCNLYLYDDKLRIDNAFTNSFYDVPLDRIYAAGRASQIRPAEFSLRGAILGDMIDGPVGAVIGGFAGARQGKATVLLIRFIDKDDSDTEFGFETVWRWTTAFDTLARHLRRIGKHNVRHAG